MMIDYLIFKSIGYEFYGIGKKRRYGFVPLKYFIFRWTYFGKCPLLLLQ